MKIVAATSDLHFDYSSRWSECLRVTDWIAEDIKERKVDLTVIPGDFYERGSKPLERNGVQRLLNKLGLVVGCGGNHDVRMPDSDGVEGGDLHILNRELVTIEEAVGVHVRNGIAVAAVAWPRKAELLATLGREVGKDESEQIARHLIRNLMLGLRDQLKQHEGPRILAMHAMVSGSTTSAGQPLVGCDMEVSLEELALTEADIVLLGHVHKPQSWTFNGIPIIYCGSPYATAYGEVEPKSYVIAEFNDKRNEKGKILRQWYNVRTPRTPMVLIETDYQPDTNSFFYKNEPVFDIAQAAGADVRFRYSVESDHSVAAKAAVAITEGHLRAAGAVAVKVEDVVNTSTRARAPEVAEARSLTDKLDVLWKVRALDVSAERRAALFAKTRELEQEIGGIAAQSLPASVHLNSFRFRGFGPYKEEVSIDLDALAGPLVAVTGPTGAGKTTMLGLALPGAIYREVPTYGSLKSIAVDRNAYVESVITNGARYTIRQLVDAVSEKGEALVTDADGQPLNTSGKLPEFDRWSEGHFPTQKVFYSSIFTAQAYSGFLGLKPGERKAVLLRALGIEVYELLAENARRRAAEAKTQFEVAQDRVVELSRASTSPAEAENSLSAAKAELTLADNALVAARAALAKAEAEARLASDEYAVAERLLAQRRDLEAKLSLVTASLTEINVRIEGNSWLISRADEIRKAVARAGELAKFIETARTGVEALKLEHAGFVQETQKHKAQAGLLEEAIAGQDRNVTRIMTRLAKKDQVEKAKSAVEPARARLSTAVTAFEAAKAECERLNGLSLTSAEDRAKALRTGHEQIMEMESSISLGFAQEDISTPVLKADDATLELAQTLPGQKRIAAARRDEGEGVIRSNERIVRELEGILALDADIAAAEAELLQVNQEREVAVNDRAEQLAFERAAGLNADDAKVRLSTAKDSLQAFNEEKEALDEGDAQYAVKLSNAETRLEELQPQKTAREAEIARLNAELQKIEVKEVGGLPVLTDEQNAVTTAEQAARTASSAVALATQTLVTARETAARIAEREVERARLSDELADWTRLADDFGRNGLQGLEIDASGPALNATTNDLLRSCYGSRFTVEIETTRKDSTGKKQIEGVFITVTDNEKGRRPAPGEEYSGGEKVIIGEAISLSLTRLSCKRSGVSQCTLVRDETAGALDEGIAPRYLEMLRRAAAPDMLDASKVLFVSHASQLWALADSRIAIEPGGKVTTS